MSLCINIDAVYLVCFLLFVMICISVHHESELTENRLNQAKNAFSFITVCCFGIALILLFGVNK